MNNNYVTYTASKHRNLKIHIAPLFRVAKRGARSLLYIFLLHFVTMTAIAQVTLEGVAVVDGLWGEDITDELTITDTITWLSASFHNYYDYDVEVTYSVTYDGTTIASGTADVWANSFSMTYKQVSPAKSLTAGSHTLSLISGSAHYDRSFTVTSGGPEMDVQGNSVSIVDGDSSPSLTDHTDFGSALIAGGTVVRTYTIRNTGTATLNLSGSPRVTVSGTHSADFTVTTQPAASVAAGGTTTFQVTFDPSAADTRTAALSIANDDANENPYNYSIQGMGTTPPEIQAPEIESDGSVVIRWTSDTSHLYTVHHSTNLTNGFTVLQGNIQGSTPVSSYTDTVNGVMMKFWKVTTED